QVRTIFDPVEPAFTHPTHHRFVLLALAAILTLRGRHRRQPAPLSGLVGSWTPQQLSPHLLPRPLVLLDVGTLFCPEGPRPVCTRGPHRTGWRRHRRGAPRQERLRQGLPSGSLETLVVIVRALRPR